MNDVQRRLVVFFLVAALIASCGGRGRALGSVEESQAKHVEEVIHLQYPYHLVKWEHYLDGGTLGVTIKDSRGRQFQFAVDGRVQPIPPESLRADTLRLPARHFYVGASHPTEKGAREVPILGNEERAILDLLDLLSVDVLTRVRRDSLVAIVLDTRHREQNYRRALQGLTENQKQGLWAGMLARSRREMNPAGMLIPQRSSRVDTEAH